ncbi:hypothetical protein ABLB90_08955 [Photorhabdus bodei]|uniref:hypothetical protein n=1 Tax=Photorhabdus TaxID=29487 RepID=UPI0015ECC2DB|nr:MULTISPECIES: hypothetical protein [Photorhabdus]MDB6367477.1 hypothetical protein [Photorhabdus bodei]
MQSYPVGTTSTVLTGAPDPQLDADSGGGAQPGEGGHRHGAHRRICYTCFLGTLG